MTKYEEKLVAAIDAYCALGNTVEEFGGLLAIASERFYPDPLYSKKFNDNKRSEIHTARSRIRKLPFGEEILKKEMK